MSQEEAIKMGLTHVHALLGKVEENMESIKDYKRNALKLKDGHSDRETILLTMSRLAEESLEQVTKASMLTSALCATQEDLGQKNAVLKGCGKRLYDCYGLLLDMQFCLGEVIS
jgi:hypothetical protein